jgi:histidine triad (HIT) family protein
MADCPFCQIVAGTLPAAVVHESRGAVAFLDAFPAARGHVLVVPRLHAPTLLDLDENAIGELFQAVCAVQRKVQKALAPIGMNVGWNHGRPAGQHVFHLHVHVMGGRAMGWPPG